MGAMMSLFTLPTREQLTTEISALIRGARPSAALGPGSDAGILRDTLAHVVSGLHIHLRYGVLHQLLPTRASGVYLDAWAWLFGLPNGLGGYGRILERGSSATDGVTVTATGATGDLENEEFSDAAGNIYRISESHTFGGAGSATLDVEAVSLGDATNVKVADSEAFTWVSTPANMSDTITQAADFTGGADEELDAALRARLSRRLQTPPQGGNWAQWVEWIEAVSPGEIRAYVWPRRSLSGSGYGCVDYAATLVNETGDGRLIASGDETWEAIESAIEEYAPVLQMLRSRQVELVAVPQVVDVTLEIADNAPESLRCDWDAESVKRWAIGADSVTRQIESNIEICSPTITGGIDVGHRVIILGTEAVVDAVNISGDAHFFSVETWPSEWDGMSLTGGEMILAGGGIIMTALDALRAMGDDLGPTKGARAAPIAGWDDQVRLVRIKTAVIQACGGTVVDLAITTPVADVVPVAGDGATENIYIIEDVRVWEDK